MQSTFSDAHLAKHMIYSMNMLVNIMFNMTMYIFNKP